MKYEVKRRCWISLRRCLYVSFMAVASIPYSHAAEKPRFGFCFSTDKQCMPGNGYAVCDAYLKHLNAMPKDRKPNGCTAWLDPNQKNFSRPDWEVLDVSQHLPWIYEMTRILPPSDKKLPPFDEWRESYLERIRKGEIQPMLKRTRLEIRKGMGIEALLAYNEGDPEMSGCRGDVPNILPDNPEYRGKTNGHIFRLDESLAKPVQMFFGLETSHEIVLYRNHPFFVSQSTGALGWEISIKRAVRPFDSSMKHYAYPLCEYEETAPSMKGASK